MPEPLISVTMPARNATAFLNQSIASVVNQTFTDFELVILNDASTDRTEEIVREWQQRDPRIRLVRSERQLGLAGSSNRVVAETRAPVVARMDADDIAHPSRMERQWKVLQTQPDVVAVGTLCEGIDSAGRIVRPRDRWRIVRMSRYLPFPHGSIMFRRAAFDAVNGYSEQFTCGEDQDFAYRLSRLGRIVTLPDALYQYRYHTANATLLTGAQAVHGAQREFSERPRSGRALHDGRDATLVWPGTARFAGTDEEKTSRLELRIAGRVGVSFAGERQSGSVADCVARLHPRTRCGCRIAGERRKALRMAIPVVVVGMGAGGAIGCVK